MGDAKRTPAHLAVVAFVAHHADKPGPRGCAPPIVENAECEHLGLRREAPGRPWYCSTCGIEWLDY